MTSKISHPQHVRRTAFTGIHRCHLDSEFGFKLPAQWHLERPGFRLAIFLTLWPRHQAGMCLRGIPQEEIQNIRQRIEVSPGKSGARILFEKLLNDEFASVIVEPTGKICLPKALAKAAGIEKEAVLIGLLDRFEIWSMEAYEILCLLE